MTEKLITDCQKRCPFGAINRRLNFVDTCEQQGQLPSSATSDTSLLGKPIRVCLAQTEEGFEKCSGSEPYKYRPLARGPIYFGI